MSAKWVRDFVRRAGGSVGVGEHRVVSLRGGPGSTEFVVGSAYSDREAACRIAAAIQTRSNFNLITYVFERYPRNRGAVWLSARCLLWEGVLPEVAS